jgi:hypothetical protein
MDFFLGRNAASEEVSDVMDSERVVITGVGLAAPNGNNLSEFRAAAAVGKVRRCAVRNPLHGSGSGWRLPL